MDTSKTSQAAVAVLCAQFVARSLAQGMKGKARDRAALEYIVGATSLAHAIGDAALFNLLGILGVLVSARGFSEIERRAKEAPADALDAMPVSPRELATQFDVACVIAVSTKRGAFGIGADLAEASRNLRRECPKATADVLRFYSCPRSELKITTGADLQIQAPLKSFCARLSVEG